MAPRIDRTRIGRMSVDSWLASGYPDKGVEIAGSAR